MDAASAAERLLQRLTPDQRAAATAPPGPVLCVAPAGSGKTTVLVARIAWLLANGRPARGICALTFNRRAAAELQERLRQSLEPERAVAQVADPVGPLPDPADAVQDPVLPPVRTFHALGLEILRSAGREVRLADRDRVLRRLLPDAPAASRLRVDTAISRLKLEADVTAQDIASDPEPGRLGRLFLAYERALHDAGALDFDDLVAASLRLLAADQRVLGRWRARCADLLVDEVQDVDRSQLELARLLAAPAHRVFLVGDDDQCIYAWRLADVRRVLGLAERLPGLRRVDLTTNFRCPPPVVDRAVRLVEHNRERFAKRILPGPAAAGRLVLAPDGDDDVARFGRVLSSWNEAAGTQAILARTNRELLPAAVAAVAADRPFRAEGLVLLVERPELDPLLAAVAGTPPDLPLLRRIASVVPAHPGDDVSPGAPPDGVARGRADPGAMSGAADPPELPDPRIAAHPLDVDLRGLRRALLAWAGPYRTLDELVAAIDVARSRLAALRRTDAALTLSTAHATKGLEFDHVAAVMDAHRFPSERSLADADDPVRALEEERRLAYVAWTRARRSLTLVYDPAAPSPFLLEAFSADELGLEAAVAP